MLWILIYKFMCGHTFLFLFSIHLWVEFWAKLNYSSIFNILRNARLLESLCCILHSHLQCMRFPVSPPNHQYFLLCRLMIFIKFRSLQPLILWTLLLLFSLWPPIKYTLVHLMVPHPSVFQIAQSLSVYAQVHKSFSCEFKSTIEVL